ncbi:MAG: hypothetical protein ACRCTZ_02790 [Sarcina sp.]
MTKIKDLVSIKKDAFFNGAVQAEWFYDEAKRKKVSESYIFHGPKYYGVSKADIKSDNYKLTDTITFTNNIYDKLYNNLDTSRFMLTIAGYGAGKSHLSLALASLLSNVDNTNMSNILENIKNADEDGYENIKNYNKDKHLVIVLNGINDFNLNMEVLKVAKETLKLHNLDDAIFNDMSMAHKTAKTFLERTFEYLGDIYLKEAHVYSKYNKLTKNELKEALTNNVEEYDVYTIINKVYESQTGNEISINEGISANSVLTKIHQKYVIEEKLFKSVIILFDEFGRYLEFASNQPTIAGETGLQQIFEAVQNGSPSMLFIGFIQSDLSAYISRVKNENINRYVGRYQISDKYYLSSNLETVLASLVKKELSSERVIANIFDNTLARYFSMLQKNILRWLPELNDKNVWSNEMMFNKTLLKGSYPIHPLTTGLLSSLSSYMQQRSTLTFLSDIFDKHKNDELDEKIPFIYPTAVIDSDIFNEMLNAEERGRVSGQYCMQYRDIIEANQETFSKSYKDILGAILIMNLAKYKVFDKNDTFLAIKEITGLSEEIVSKTLAQLETTYGVIFFDTELKRYNFMSDGNSKVDFNKLLFKKKVIANKKNILGAISDELAKELGLDKAEESEFGILNNIVTGEWSYTKEIIDIEDFDYDRARQIQFSIDSSNSVDTSRGKLINLYCNDENYFKVDEIVKNLKLLNYENSAIAIMLIHDQENRIKESLFNIRALNSFTVSEKETFKKFYDKELKENIKLVIRTYTRCAGSKKYITENGIVIETLNIKKVMCSKFEKTYTKTVPFAIDSFEKKIGAKSRRYYYSVIDALLSGKLDDEIEFNSLPVDVKNRINSIFSSKSERGWKVFFGNNTVSTSQNPIVNEICTEIVNEIKGLPINKSLKIKKFTTKYKKAPYGMNEYSAALMVIYALFLIKENLIIVNKNQKNRLIELKEIFASEKGIKFGEFDACDVFYTQETQGDKVLDLISKIEKNRGVSIEVAVELYTPFEQLDERDVPNESRGRYFSCKDKIHIAYRKNLEINDMIRQMGIKANEIKKRPISIIQLLTDGAQIKEGLIPNMNYMYSVKQIEAARELEKQGENNFKAILGVYYESVNLNDTIDHEKNLKICIKKLTDLGYKELATLTKNTLAKYKKRKVAYEELKVDIDKLKQVVLYLEENIKNADKLELIEEEVIYWENKKEKLLAEGFDEIKISYNKIEKFKLEISELKKNIEYTLEAVINEIKLINSIGDIANVSRFINNKINSNIPSKMKEELMKQIENLSKIKEELSIFLYKNFTLEALKSTITKLSLDYKEDIIMFNLISRLNESLINKHKEFESKWIREYLLEDSEIEESSLKSLNNIIRNSSSDYEYLSKELQEKQQKLIVKINVRLKKFKIDNIVNLFEELSNDEKEKCIEILNSL